jgi:hypothetical protein
VLVWKVSAVPDSPHVLEKYADRLRADLEANIKERQRLQNVLHQLEHEYEVLVKMQVTLDAGAETVELLLKQNPAGDTPAPAKPSNGKDFAPANGGSHHGMDDSHLLSGHRRGRRPGERSLIDVVSTLLREQKEPRSVAEIREAMMTMRPATEQTVRNTLDRLVATNKAKRTKQGRSVFYSPTSTLLQDAANRQSATGEQDTKKETGAALL